MSYYGDIDNPAKLDVVMSWTRIGPADTVYLRGGTYSGDFTCALNGTAALPLIFRAYPGERPIIDGSLTISGNYTHWYDLEITYSGWTGRDEVPNGTNPGHGLTVSGTGNKMTGCIVHDTGGNGSWQANTGGGFSGCLIYNCGWLSPDGGHGHAIYTQNEFATQYHHNNILWGQYGFGMHGYTAAGLINYFDLRQNICFRNDGRQFALGGLGGQRAHNCVVDENVMLEGDGYLKGDDITLTNNYSPNGFTIEGTSERVTQSGNTFTAPESGTNIFVFPRVDKSGWAHVAIYNWDSANSVDLDVSGVTGLGVGDGYKLHNAQDYFDDIATGTVAESQIIAVDMRAVSHSVEARVGSSALASTFPAFGAFVLEKA